MSHRRVGRCAGTAAGVTRQETWWQSGVGQRATMFDNERPSQAVSQRPLTEAPEPSEGDEEPAAQNQPSPTPKPKFLEVLLKLTLGLIPVCLPLLLPGTDSNTVIFRTILVVFLTAGVVPWVFSAGFFNFKLVK